LTLSMLTLRSLGKTQVPPAPQPARLLLRREDNRRPQGGS
jgi:hypothetical protein